MYVFALGKTYQIRAKVSDSDKRTSLSPKRFKLQWSNLMKYLKI